MAGGTDNPHYGDYYETYWTEEGYNPRRSQTPQSLETLLRQHVRRTDDCIDVGCGDGGTSGVWLAQHAARYVGVDVSSTAVAKARAKGLSAEHIADAASLPFPDESFDVAVCVEVFEHLFTPHAAAAEIFRVLRPGGCLIATVPNAIHWRERIDMLLGHWKPRGDDLGTVEPWRSPHIRFFSQRTLKRMLLHAGFSRVDTGGLADAPFLIHIPVVRRLLRTARPSRLYLRAVALAPSLVSPGIWTLARREPRNRGAVK